MRAFEGLVWEAPASFWTRISAWVGKEGRKKKGVDFFSTVGEH